MKGVSSTSWASASSSFLISASVMVLIMIEVMTVIVRTYYESFEELSNATMRVRRWDDGSFSCGNVGYMKIKIMIRRLDVKFKCGRFLRREQRLITAHKTVMCSVQDFSAQSQNVHLS